MAFNCTKYLLTCNPGVPAPVSYTRVYRSLPPSWYQVHVEHVKPFQVHVFHVEYLMGVCHIQHAVCAFIIFTAYLTYYISYYTFSFSKNLLKYGEHDHRRAASSRDRNTAAVRRNSHGNDYSSTNNVPLEQFQDQGRLKKKPIRN